MGELELMKIGRGYRMRLAIAQMVLGVLIVGISVLVAVVAAAFGFVIFLVLGLAVLGCGIAQYLEARG